MNFSLRPMWLNNKNSINTEINFGENKPINNSLKKNKLIEYILLDSKKYMLNFEDFLEFINNEKFDLEKCNVNNINFNYYKLEEDDSDWLDDSEFLENIFWEDDEDFENNYFTDQAELDNLEKDKFDEYLYYKHLDNSDSEYDSDFN